MRAVVCRELSGPQSLSVEEVPDPKPGPGEVAVDVAAAGLNFADTLMVTGKYQEKPELPFTPGLELAGTVTALGAGVTGLGQPICEPHMQCFFSGYAAPSEDHVQGMAMPNEPAEADGTAVDQRNRTTQWRV